MVLSNETLSNEAFPELSIVKTPEIGSECESPALVTAQQRKIVARLSLICQHPLAYIRWRTLSISGATEDLNVHMADGWKTA